MTFFGPDLRNGLPIGLGSVAGFGIAPRFSPASLFPAGVNGAWYDPSDATTLFSDRAGTTPCGTPGGGSVVPVGLMLDKSQGLVLGSEALTNPGPGFTVTTGWTSGRAATLSIASGTLRVTNTVAYGQAYQAITTVVGTTYRVTVTVANAATLFDIFVGTTGPETGLIVQRSNNAAGTYTFYFTATTTTSWLTFGNSGASAGNTFDLVSATLKALAGNHAIAANDTTARPELRARVNLLTYSTLQGGGAAPTGWTQPVATGTSAPSGTAANGDIIYTQSATAQRPFLQQSVVLTANVQYRLSFTITAATGLLYQDIIGLNTVEPISYFLNGVSVSSTATVSLGTVSITWTSAGGTTGLRIGTGVFGNATGSLTFSSPDLRPTNIGTAMPAYQRISDANTYDAVGFPRYLAFNGTSSAMSTPGNVNLSGTDKATVFAGVRKLAVATGFPVEFSAAAESNNGAFRIGVDSGGIEYFASSRGTVSQQVNVDNAAYLPPVSNVVQSSFDISGPSVSMRLNGAAVGTNTASQGTGNFGSYPLFIGSRNNASFFLNGNIYSLIVVGSAVSAGNITSTEQWVAGKVGITI